MRLRITAALAVGLAAAMVPPPRRTLWSVPVARCRERGAASPSSDIVHWPPTVRMSRRLSTRTTSVGNRTDGSARRGAGDPRIPLTGPDSCPRVPSGTAMVDLAEPAHPTEVGQFATGANLGQTSGLYVLRTTDAAPARSLD